MPKREILSELPGDPNFPHDPMEALRKMRQVLAHDGQVCTAKEEREFSERRGQGNIETLPAQFARRNKKTGEWEYREVVGWSEDGEPKVKAGAASPVPTFYRTMLKRYRDSQTEVAKALRRPPRSSSRLRERVIAANAAVPKGRGRIKEIARQAGCSPKQVARILQESGHLEGR